MNYTGNNNMRTTHDTELPPLPPNDVSGPLVCATIHVYLAVWDDLPLSQKQRVSQHMQACPGCERALQMMKHSTHLVACLDTSEPSARVDEAVMAAIAARRQAQHSTKSGHLAPRRQRSSPNGFPRMAALGGVAAAVLLAAFLSAYFIMGIGQPQQAFAFPANVSWDKYVLFHKQTAVSPQGHEYQVASYHNMSDASMHTEMVMDNKVHVLVVKDQRKTLGLDLMHHVAQWNVQGVHALDVDDSMFDLAALRKDLQSGRAKYLGKEQFQGRLVYRVRTAQGDILLLNMQYMPINALPKGQEAPNSRPMFDQLQWLQPGSVPESIWSMKVPPDFKMGKISAQL